MLIFKRYWKIILSAFIVLLLITSLVFNIVFLVKIENNELPDFSFDDMANNAYELTEGADIRVMSYNVLVGSWGGYDLLGDDIVNADCVRSQMLGEMLNAYLPDVVGLQEFSSEWKNDIYDYLGDYVLFDVKNSDYTTIAYNASTTILIESGRVDFDDRTGINNTGMRYIEWGYFQDIDSGSKYLVTNTHLDFGEEKRDMQWSQIVQTKDVATELVAEYDVPIFILGDFNAREWGDTVDSPITDDDAVAVYNYMLADDFSVDAKYVENITLYMDSVSDFLAGSWDHIYVNGNAEVLGFGQMSSAYFTTLSDHYPIFADIKL